MAKSKPTKETDWSAKLVKSITTGRDGDSRYVYRRLSGGMKLSNGIMVQPSGLPDYLFTSTLHRPFFIEFKGPKTPISKLQIKFACDANPIVVGATVGNSTPSSFIIRLTEFTTNEGIINSGLFSIGYITATSAKYNNIKYFMDYGMWPADAILLVIRSIITNNLQNIFTPEQREVMPKVSEI